MNIAVVDDERPARSELVFLLSSIYPEAGIFEADSAKAARDLIEKEKFQVMFLDINLGNVKGTVLASLIREKQPQAGIVFVTAYQDYAVEAFELDAVDYILKPYDLKRIQKAMQKLQERGFLEEKKEDTADSGLSADKLAIHGGNRIFLVDINDVIFLEANQRTCHIYTKDHVYEETVPLTGLMEKLKDHNFFRVHKSFAVNLSAVEEILPSYNNGYSLRMKYYEKKAIPISRNQVKTIRELFTIK